MKKTIKLLESLHEHLELKISEREETFENHSEKWQESEKGEEYESTTEIMQDMAGQISDWIEELTNL